MTDYWEEWYIRSQPVLDEIKKNVLTEDGDLQYQDDEYTLFGDKINAGHFVGAAVGAIYVASPLDLIPDFIPVIGYVDDALVFRASVALGGWIGSLF